MKTTFFTSIAALLVALLGGVFLAANVRADACCMVTCDMPVCECERLVNTNSCGTRTVCSPAACGLGIVGTKLAAGAAKTDVRASEDVKEALEKRDNKEAGGNAELAA